MWLSLRTIHGISVIFRRSRRKNNSLVQPLPCQSWLPSQLQQKSRAGGAGGTSERCWVTLAVSQEPISKIHNLQCFLPTKAARTERYCCPFPPLGSPACAPPTWGSLCSASHYWGWQSKAGSSSSAQEWGEERWKYTPSLAGCSRVHRQISPTASSASPFPHRARAKGFNVSRSITTI